MRCEKHNDKEAYAICDRCGVGICTNCAGITRLAKISHKVMLCPDCYREFCRVNMESHRKKKTTYIVKMVFNIILLIIGAIIALPAITAEGGTDYVTMFAGFAVAGAVGVIDALRNEKKKEAEYERKHGAIYTVYTDNTNSVKVAKDDKFMEKFIGRFMAIMLATILAPITSPIRIISYIPKIKYYSDGIAFCQTEMERTNI